MDQRGVPAEFGASSQLIAERVAEGDVAGAMRQLTELLEQFGVSVAELGEALGHDHLATVCARHLFADRPQPDPHAALMEWSQVVADEQRVLGAEHPLTLISRGRVAQQRKGVGDYEGAIAEGEQVLAARRRVLSDDHEDTFSMRLFLAAWRGEAFDVEAAVAELRPLVEDMCEKLGADHRHTLIAKHTLLLWGPDPDDPRDAVADWEALVDDEARVLGADFSATVAAREELAKRRADLEEYRWMAERIYQQVGILEPDDDESSEAQAVADADGEAWAAERAQAFADWAGGFGGSEIWDFTSASLHAIANVVFHRCPTVAHLDEPANAAFTDGATWYLGEILRRAQPRKWRWAYYDKDEPRPADESFRVDESLRADAYRLARIDNKDWSIMPRRKLNWLIESGNPLHLYDDDHYFSHPHPWPPGYFDNTDTGPWTWTWTGELWQSQLELWLIAVPIQIATLASDHLPKDITLDYSAESLRRIEEFAIGLSMRGIQDPDFNSGVIAYIGEALLRTVGGRWLWDDREHSVTRGFPVVLPHLDSLKGTISPTHLLSFALQWRDGATLTRVYEAQCGRVAQRKAEDPTWTAMRSLTPGLDETTEAAPDYCDVWRAEQRREFPNWVVRYGAERTWDFSRDSLLALGDIMAEPDRSEAEKQCAAWYFGETLHRARPSYWRVGEVGDRPTDPWSISLTTHGRRGFVGSHPLQDIDGRLLRRGPDDTTWLRNAYDRWVMAETRERIEEARKRRLRAKSKAAQKLSDHEYLQRWLDEREAQFVTWVRDYGRDGVWDFSPASLDALEDRVVERGATPEQLLDDEHNAPFVDGALWYFGEALRRGSTDRALPWQYVRGNTADPTVGQIDPLEVLTDVLTSIDRGTLRDTYDLVTASRTEDPVNGNPLDWWLDRINLLIDMTGDVDLGGAIELDYSVASLAALEDAARDRLADPVEALYDDQQSFTAGVVAYLGEALMRIGGGRWDWGAEAPADVTVSDPLLRQRLAEHRWRIDSAGEPDAEGFPIVRPDPATGLVVLSPTHLLLEALASDGGAVWANVYEHWKRVVLEYAAAQPGWTPTKDRTLADGVFSAPPPSAVLDDWLAREAQRFPDWAAGAGGDWDFSPDSINPLVDLVLRVTPTVEALRDPANADFVEGASYYLGEVLRRGCPSRWVYREFRDEGDPITANFQIQLNDDEGFTGPFHLLCLAIKDGGPSHTRAYYDVWVG
jgi:hypothetical protein